MFWSVKLAPKELSVPLQQCPKFWGRVVQGSLPDPIFLLNCSRTPHGQVQRVFVGPKGPARQMQWRPSAPVPYCTERLAPFLVRPSGRLDESPQRLQRGPPLGGVHERRLPLPIAPLRHLRPRLSQELDEVRRTAVPDEDVEGGHRSDRAAGSSREEGVGARFHEEANRGAAAPERVGTRAGVVEGRSGGLVDHPRGGRAAFGEEADGLGGRPAGIARDVEGHPAPQVPPFREGLNLPRPGDRGDELERRRLTLRQ
mmetsp:Transcript_47482/g.143717  ORF Transcript_47482/g.143717 Transcript_47482/m.143717 type:complete len:256 (-) Transcript_47482:118-885(-)